MARDQGRTSQTEISIAPLGRQVSFVGIVLVLLAGAVLVTRSHATSGKGDQAASALNPNQIQIAQAAAEAIELKTAKVTLEPAKHAIHTSGVIHFLPYATINVSPRLTGKVRDVFVKIGDHVMPGQPLAEMVSSDAANAVDTARDDDAQVSLTASALATARQQFAMGTPEVTAAEATLAQARENARFMKRALDLERQQNSIGGFTDKPLTDAQSAAKQSDTQLAQDLKDLALTQKQYDRTAKLFGFGVAAKADVEAAEDAVGKARDAVSNDREQARIAHVTVEREIKAFNSRLYANQALSQADTNYQEAVIQEGAATTAVRMAKAAILRDLKQAEHDYRAAKADAHAAHVVLSTYDDPTADGHVIVRAPAKGTVTARNVNPGQIVDQTGQTPWQMFTIVNSGTVYVDVQVYEKDMIGVKIGEAVTAESDALPRHSRATGAVSFVAPGLDPATHALSVRAILDNHAGLLKDGMFVTVSLDVGATSPLAPVPIVPLTAVVHDGNDDYVFVEAAQGRYDRRKVTLGEQRGEDRVAITEGLTGNETIVTHGALYLGTGGTADD